MTTKKFDHIAPDDGVPMPKSNRGRRPNETYKHLVDKFLAMKPGQSFFVEGANRRDVEFLRRLVVKAGAGIESIETKSDEIFGTAGVRTWRRAGPYDDEL